MIDGSTDGTGEQLQRMVAGDNGVRVFVLPRNQGKGAAVLHGLREAAAAGYTHALTMDSDGQHPADLIESFMRASQRAPQAMILGKPVFGPEAPRVRVLGRKISNGLAAVETLWGGIARFALWISRLSDRAADRRHAAVSLGCGASISIWKRQCVWCGAASRRSIFLHRSSI